MRIITSLILTMMFFGCSFFTQSTRLVKRGAIVGCVYNSDSGEFVSGANVIVPDSAHIGTLTENGRFVILNLLPGQYNLVASKITYRPHKIFAVQVAPDSASRVEFFIHSDAIPEDPVSVTWERTGINILPLDDDSTLNFVCGVK